MRAKSLRRQFYSATVIFGIVVTHPRGISVGVDRHRVVPAESLPSIVFHRVAIEFDVKSSRLSQSCGGLSPGELDFHD
ncbi:hypothetical protein ACFOS0_05150, partial [Nocardia seriolae]